MDWVQLRVTVRPELVEPVVSLFKRYAKDAVVVEEAGGFNPDDGELPNPEAPLIVTAYYPRDRRASWRSARIDIGLRLLSLITPIPGAEENTLNERAWEEAWKGHFPLLRIGERLLIAPPWLEVEAAQGQTLVRLDPGLAFGTGHHPTTKRCLMETLQLTGPGARVLDVGCGSGILSIVAAKLGSGEVVALDTDTSAVRATRRNARAERVSRAVRVRKGTLPQPDLGVFDLVLANISARALVALAEHLRNAVAPGGYLVGSGLLAERRDEVVGALVQAGLVLVREHLDDEWVTLVCQGPGAGR
jgi:ribosomal protein L11 methyltransferase